jgi:hypothetical protein
LQARRVESAFIEPSQLCAEGDGSISVAAESGRVFLKCVALIDAERLPGDLERQRAPSSRNRGFTRSLLWATEGDEDSGAHPPSDLDPRQHIDEALDRSDDRDETTHPKDQPKANGRVAEDRGKHPGPEEEISKGTEYDGGRDDRIAELHTRNDIGGDPDS